MKTRFNLPADLREELARCLSACTADSTPMPEILMLQWGNEALRDSMIRTYGLDEAQVNTITRAHTALLERDPTLRHAEETARATRARFQPGVLPDDNSSADR